MDKLRTAWTMALLPRAARHPGGAHAGQPVTPADSYLALSSGILRIIDAAEALWERGSGLRARRLRAASADPAELAARDGALRC